MIYLVNGLLIGFALLLVLGCAPQQTATEKTQSSVPIDQTVESSASDAASEATSTATAKRTSVRSAFTHDENLNRAILDTQVAPPQKQTFWLGLGSVTIETVSVSEGILKLRYTEEVEGGYSVSECEVEISPTPVVFQFGSDGTPGEPPDALRNCKPIRSGNVHFDPSGTDSADDG